jgi:hypothetical protein
LASVTCRPFSGESLPYFDGIAARLAAEAQADDPPLPMPDDYEARLDLAARVLAEEMRTLRDLMSAPGAVVGPALEDRG